MYLKVSASAKSTDPPVILGSSDNITSFFPFPSSWTSTLVINSDRSLLYLVFIGVFAPLSTNLAVTLYGAAGFVVFSTGAAGTGSPFCPSFLTRLFIASVNCFIRSDVSLIWGL